MIDIVKQIIATDLKEVLNTPLSLQLLKCYSVLYLNGAAPRCCSRSQTLYYNQLQVNGVKKAIEMENIFNKTCLLNSDLLIFVRQHGSHVSNSNITDELAIKGLDAGWFKESQFVKLPNNYIIKSERIHSDVVDLEKNKNSSDEVNNKGRRATHKRKA